MYKIFWLKGQNENKFNIPKMLGMEVFELEDLEKTDEKLNELKKDNYNIVVISNTVAAHSQDLIKKYKNDENFNIIISREKN